MVLTRDMKRSLFARKRHAAGCDFFVENSNVTLSLREQKIPTVLLFSASPSGLPPRTLKASAWNPRGPRPTGARVSRKFGGRPPTASAETRPPGSSRGDPARPRPGQRSSSAKRRLHCRMQVMLDRARRTGRAGGFALAVKTRAGRRRRHSQAKLAQRGRGSRESWYSRTAERSTGSQDGHWRWDKTSEKSGRSRRSYRSSSGKND
jgi:hypothetical protein